MMRLLIVDDDGDKRRRIERSIREGIGEGNVEAVVATNASDAANLLEATAFDLLVLDINLPLRADDSPRHDGGLKLLRQINRGGPRMIRPQYIIGLTAYGEVLTRSADEFAASDWQVLECSPESKEWEDVLAAKAIHIAEVRSRREEREANRVDLCILTAMKEVELEAVLRLPAEWRVESTVDDDTIYHRGAFVRGGKRLEVAATAAPHMGMPAAACIAMKLIERYRPRVLVMAGIAAGVGCQLGDIIVADKAWDYGSGKSFEGEGPLGDFSPSPDYLPIDPGLKEKLDLYAMSRADVFARIRAGWQGNPLPHALSARVGPVASGAFVVENEAMVDMVKGAQRKVSGIEMEVYGVYLACRLSTAPRPLFFAAKSACDFAVPPKSGDHQRYAAYTSANFVHEFALDEL